MGHKLWGNPEGRLPVGETDLDVLIANAVADDLDRAAFVDLLRESLDEPPTRMLPVTPMGLHERVPLRALRPVDEREQLDGVKADGRVEVPTPLGLGANLGSHVS